MEAYIKDCAIGYYNDERVEVIRDLEKGYVLCDTEATNFIHAYKSVLPESLRIWTERHKPFDKEERRRLASEILDANPTGWTDKDALDVVARKFANMVKNARYYTERGLLSGMIGRLYPEVVPRMEELYTQDADNDRWFSEFLDRAELNEAGQAPSD